MPLHRCLRLKLIEVSSEHLLVQVQVISVVYLISSSRKTILMHLQTLHDCLQWVESRVNFIETLTLSEKVTFIGVDKIW